MYCVNCGNKMADGDKFCSNCGSAIATSGRPKDSHEPLKSKNITWEASGTVSIVYSFVDLITSKTVLGFTVPPKNSLTGDWFYKNGELTRRRLKKQTIKLNQTIKKVQIISDDEKELSSILNPGVATPLNLVSHASAPLWGMYLNQNKQKQLLKKRLLRILTKEYSFEMFVPDKIFVELITNARLLEILDE